MVNKMSIGKISEFKVQSDNWKLYVERLEQYFLVNKIGLDLQVPTLITVMGAESYELLVSLCTPDKPNIKSFNDLTTIMANHLQPKPSELAERYKFRHRKQGEAESIAEYVAVLKKMSKSCEFGIGLQESLRDQLVCGIKSEIIRQRLFAESKLDFSKAYNLSVSLEAAEKDAAMVMGNAKLGSEASVVECQAVYGRGRRPAAAARGQRAWRAAPHGSGAGAVDRPRPQQGCRACGGAHEESGCTFRAYVCRVCMKRGHIRRMCPNVTTHHAVDVTRGNYEAEQDSDTSDEVMLTDINQVAISECKPIIISVVVNSKVVKMECDTGSAVSCVSEEVYNRYFRDLPIKPCKLTLRYYTGEIVKPVGLITPLVKYKETKKLLDLYIVKNAQSMLLGRQWISELNITIPCLNIKEVHNVNLCNFNLNVFSSRYCNVFADGLGRFTGEPVRIYVVPDARPVFMRARPLAYALRGPVERALAQMVQDGILTAVERSEWATPIVPVVKKDGNIRICADYKLTLNKVIEVDRYPLPRVEDLLTKLHGGDRFSKIDLSQAYAQFVLDDTCKYTVINTHKGLFRYNRLVYGLSSSPAIFQKRLEQLFEGLEHVGVFIDDIIITGKSTEEHIDNLHKVFQRLEKYGLRVKKEKCDFFKPSVKYLGYVISRDGVHTCPDKVKAIEDTPAPTNISDLKAFIGMVMYYSKFIRNISTILAPLYNLLRKGVKFEWGVSCQKAFQQIKDLLSSSDVLTHYSMELPLLLTADASSVGVGAVLSHATAAGERPVAYASRALSAAERAYSQIDREALAIVFGLRKYHQYLYGRKFLLRTDHKPLTHIFGKKVGIPIMAASRLQRWAVLLAGYNYDIEYVASNKNCADSLSRLPSTPRKDAIVNEITYVKFVQDFLPVTNEDVKKATVKDAILNRIYAYVKGGWPSVCPEDELKPYFTRRNELYIDYGCIMWGYRMVVPSALRSIVLKEIHSGHMGIVKSKGIARSFVWWPNIDAEVEETCQRCETCAVEASAPPRASPQPWPYHTQPWTRIHVDFLGPYQGKTYLVLTDSSSKWLDLCHMPRTNASNVIKTLRTIFACFGLPIELMSDQGPPFASNEFKEFLKRNGIRQSFAPVYHPQSNGAAENAVKLCKRTIKKAIRDNADVEASIQSFLLAYRNAVHLTTGETPAMLLQRRSLRTRLDLLRGERGLEKTVHTAQQRQVQNARGMTRKLGCGDSVWVREYGQKDKWAKGVITDKLGSRRFTVSDDNGRLITRHMDQIKQRARWSGVTCPTDDDDEAKREDDIPIPESAETETTHPNTSQELETEPNKEIEQSLTKNPTVVQDSSSPPQVAEPTEDRPKRLRKKVDRFGCT